MKDDASPPATRVLVTGAYGNIGSAAVRALVARGHRVRGLSLSRRADRRVIEGLPSSVEVMEGDVRDRAAMDRAVAGCDAVVHLAYVIPPLALERPEEARSVNVGGTRALLDACLAAPTPPCFLFASTLDVYGHTQHLPPPRRVTDPLHATDVYSEHKIACEQMVREAALRWSIYRFADVPPIAVRAPHPIMFRLPLSTRIHVLHPDDAGHAVARGVELLAGNGAPAGDSAGASAGESMTGRTLHIGGGAGCQLIYRDYLGAFLEAMGIGALPEAAFSTEPYCTDWLDTEESQRLLGYQRRGFDDVVRETAALLGWRRPLARALRPVVRYFILRMSPHWRARGPAPV